MEKNENISEQKTARRKRVKFCDLDKSEKPLRIVNLVLAYGIIAFILATLTCRLARGVLYNRIPMAIALALVMAAPLALEAIFSFRFSNFTLLFISIYMIVAGILGTLIGLYGYRDLNYDKFVHVLLGYCSGIAGLFVIIKLGDYDKMKTITLAIFLFAFALAVGSIWELWEFSTDMIIGNDAQGVKLPEWGNYPTVKDTMWDIVADFAGGVIFLIHFIIHKLTKKNLLIGSIVKDFKGIKK